MESFDTLSKPLFLNSF